MEEKILFKNLGFQLHSRGTVLLWEKKKLVNILIPKNGTNFFKRNLTNGEAVVWMGWKGLDLFELKSKGYIITVVIRDPIERFVSQYFEILKCRINTDLRGITKNLPFYNIKNELKRYEEFIDNVKDSFYEPHLIPQSYLIDGYVDIIDYYFLLKEIEIDVLAFNSIYGNILIPKFKKVHEFANKTLQKKLIKFSNERRIYNKIRLKYEKDFELYNAVKLKKLESENG